MSENIFMVTNDHADLKSCIGEYPNFLRVFHNIRFGRPAIVGLEADEMAGFYSDNLFIPLLLKNGIIQKNKEAPSGFKANFEDVVLDPQYCTRKDLATLVTNGQIQIRDSVTETDDAENTVFAYIEGQEEIESLTKFMNEQRYALNEFLKNKSTDKKNSRRFKLSFSMKIEKD